MLSSSFQVGTDPRPHAHVKVLTPIVAGFVNVVLFLTTRRVLPMHSVFPRGVSQIFSRSSVAGSSRASSYTTSSYTTDVEKSTISDEQKSLTRSLAPLSALPSAAPTPYTTSAASPIYVIGSAKSETYDQISLDSADANRRSFTQEVDIASVPYHSGYQLSRAESPSIAVPIPSGAFSPQGSSPTVSFPPPSRLRSHAPERSRR